MISYLAEISVFALCLFFSKLFSLIKLICLCQVPSLLKYFPRCLWCSTSVIWTASSEFGTYRLCEQRRFRRACASAQSRQNLRCSLIQAVSHEEHSDRKPDPWPLRMAGHAQLKFDMTECSKTQIRLTRLICWFNMYKCLKPFSEKKKKKKKKKKMQFFKNCIGGFGLFVVILICI